MCEKVEVFANFRGLRTFKCSRDPKMVGDVCDVRLPDVLNDSDDEASIPAGC